MISFVQILFVLFVFFKCKNTVRSEEHTHTHTHTLLSRGETKSSQACPMFRDRMMGPRLAHKEAVLLGAPKASPSHPQTIAYQGGHRMKQKELGPEFKVTCQHHYLGELFKLSELQFSQL